MHADALIVGSGAGGGPLALELSEAGFNVVVLEKGHRYSREDYTHDEIMLSDEMGFFVPRPARDPHVVVDENGEARRSTFGWIASCVGGGTTHMGASLYRFHPNDFRLRSECGPFEDIADWPYTYDDLEPYYSRAEWALGVSGAAGSNPFEGARSRPLPMPPLNSHPLSAEFDAVCKTMSLHPYPTPRAINSRPFAGRPECEYCSFCAGYGCPTGARGTIQETVLARAENTGRCLVLPDSFVYEIVVGKSGLVDSCLFFDRSGNRHKITSDLVCVCCSAVESARLLLMSRSPTFPDGIGNGSGLVGRGLQFHSVSSGVARFVYERHSRYSLRDRNPILGRSLMDYYLLPSGITTLGKGGLLRFDMRRPQPVGDAQALAVNEGDPPLWGEKLQAAIKQKFLEAREVEFEAFHDSFARNDCFVDLDPDVQDGWGLPVARIMRRASSEQVKVGVYLTSRAREVLERLGADEVNVAGVGEIGNRMFHGTCRASAERNRGVLNGFCQSHEVPNLFVIDGSFMPTSGGAPTTLTIVANSFRSADYIIERSRTGEFSRYRPKIWTACESRAQ